MSAAYGEGTISAGLARPIANFRFRVTPSYTSTHAHGHCVYAKSKMVSLIS